MKDRAQQIANQLLNNPSSREEYEAWWYVHRGFLFTKFEGVLWRKNGNKLTIACTDGVVREIEI